MTEKKYQKVFILGGTGFLGYYVLRALDDAALSMAILLHKKKDDLDIPFEGYKLYEGSILDMESLKKSFEDFRPDVVINMVGAINESSPQKTFGGVHIAGTKNILEAAKLSGVKKIIYVSELGVGQANKAYFKTRKSAEDMIKSSGMEWTIFRPTTMFGWRNNFTGGIVRQINSFVAIPVVRKSLRPLSAEVLAKGIAQSALGEKGNSKIYEVAGPENLRYSEIVSRLKQNLNSDKRALRVPVFAVKLFGLGMNKAQKHVVLNAYNKGNFDAFQKDFSNIEQIAFDPAGEHPLA